MADNDKIDIRLETEHLEDALKFALLMIGRTPTHYSITEKFGMVFHDFRFEDARKECNPIPSWQKPISLLRDWLDLASPNEEHLDEEENDIDHDGSNVIGFRISNGNLWGHVNEDSSAFLCVKPVYLWLGK